MVDFFFFIVWIDSKSEWCQYSFSSADAMIEDRLSFLSGLHFWAKIVAFRSLKSPESKMMEYLGDFIRENERVVFKSNFNPF